jgi:putative tryptophan/tyrosine transport system substrate-binding protein
VAILKDVTEPGTRSAVKETGHVAQSFGVQLHYMEIQRADDIETAFHVARSKRAEAILLLSSAIFNSNRKLILDLASKNRLPGMYHRAEYVEEGGLMMYGVNTPDLYRRAATYVDKILKGAKPGDLPVEPPTKFDFMINLRTAKQLGLTIPANVLARADKVIK